MKKPDFKELKAGQYIIFETTDVIGITPHVPYLLREITNAYGNKVLRIHDSRGNRRAIAVMDGDNAGYLKLGARADFTVHTQRFAKPKPNISIPVNTLQEAITNNDITSIVELEAYLKGFIEAHKEEK